MEKRLLIAIILSIVILIGYQYIVTTIMPPPAEQPVQEPAIETKEPAALPAIPMPAPAVPAPKIAAPADEREIRVETELYEAVFTTRGGTIKSIKLKEYTDKDNKPIILKGDVALLPLSIGIDEGFQFANVNFLTTGTDIKLGPGLNTATLIFEYSTEEYSIRRTYTLYNDDYGISLKDEVIGLNSYWITLGKNFGIHDHDKEAFVHVGPVILKGADKMEFTAERLKEARSFKENIKWIAQKDKYFFSAIVPKTPIETARALVVNNDAIVAFEMPGGVNNYFVYAGPQEYDRLKKFGYGLEHIINFGFFSFLAIPLFWLLKLFYNVFHNYGIAIIMLTIIVRIPFVPIIHKGQKSMKKLQDLQPKMTEIRERHKKDPQKMQKELMELYKKHKVNPMGGCLPILLQIPVFFALYKVLLIAIELRDAPFVLWIQDLSARDPYYILPIIMGATMVLQQKMTPTAMDPMQQKIMMFLPVIFTFLFLTFPSGLVLYWLVNNVLSIVQQFYVNKKLQKQEA
jgi:YidC/Oxa1 family membrane protein insertase